MYKKILENIILPFGDRILKTTFITDLRRWRKLEMQSPAQIKSLQLLTLKGLLEHASKSNQYYKSLNIQSNSDPELWLKSFPILTKTTIKSNIEGMIDGDKNVLVRHLSSGSSGIQGEVYMTKSNESNQQAVQTRWWEWSGYRLGDKIMQTGMTPTRSKVKAIKDKLFRTRYINAFKSSPQTLADIAKDLSSGNNYDFIMGYASSIYGIADYLKSNNIKSDKLKGVVSWGDKLFPHYRKTLEDVFNCETFDTYGCSEGFMIAAECQYHKLHIMTPLVYLEIVDDDGNEVKPGQLGKVIVTRLDNKVMPLIRFYLGDLAVVAPESETCSCDRPYPILERVIGRDTDIVKTKSGKSMVVHFFTGIFEFYPNIKQFRVIQRDLNGMEIEIIKENDFNESDLDKIKTTINNFLEEDFPTAFTYVNEIPATASGKPQIIQSFIVKKF
ncbi:MAG: hypothetical protein SGJ04_04430 [Bacteroidota bacterium]|nr:hypothetical protein [Bacteroidota bacterium]